MYLILPSFPDPTERSIKNPGISAKFLPEIAISIFLLAPNVDTPTSFRSSSERVRNVWKSIWWRKNKREWPKQHQKSSAQHKLMISNVFWINKFLHEFDDKMYQITDSFQMSYNEYMKDEDMQYVLFVWCIYKVFIMNYVSRLVRIAFHILCRSWTAEL